MFKFTAILIRM